MLLSNQCRWPTTTRSRRYERLSRGPPATLVKYSSSRWWGISPEPWALVTPLSPSLPVLTHGCARLPFGGRASSVKTLSLPWPVRRAKMSCVAGCATIHEGSRTSFRATRISRKWESRATSAFLYWTVTGPCSVIWLSLTSGPCRQSRGYYSPSEYSRPAPAPSSSV